MAAALNSADDEWARNKVASLIAFCRQAYIPGARTSEYEMTFQERMNIQLYQQHIMDLPLKIPAQYRKRSA